MALDFSGKSVLITGGAIGIGAGIVSAFAEAGASVGFTYFSHQPEDLPQVNPDAKIVSYHLDATDENDVNQVVSQLAEDLGGFDVVVNNSGGMVQRSAITSMSLDLWHRVMDVNLTSCFLVTRAALGHLRDGGAIINVASLAGEDGGGAGASAYAASKAAIIGYTKGLAKELAPRQIRVNAVAPGLILDTPFHETFNTEEGRRKAIDGIALKKPGYPADVAGPILWLADNETSGFVTGTTIDMNGGSHFR